jgi:hypothetical protein
VAIIPTSWNAKDDESSCSRGCYSLLALLPVFLFSAIRCGRINSALSQDHVFRLCSIPISISKPTAHAKWRRVYPVIGQQMDLCMQSPWLGVRDGASTMYMDEAFG